MDFFESRYFRIPKALQISVGLWPYHPYKKIFRTLWLSSVIIATAPQVIGLKVNYNDTGRLMEHILLCFVPFGMFMKLFTLLVAEEKSKTVYDGIVENWTTIIDDEEKSILKKYSERARTINIVYLSFQSAVYLAFIILPLMPVILNKLDPLDEPREYLYVLHGEFLVKNKDDYYFFIYAWDLIATTNVLAVGAPIDSSYCCTVEHLLGLYAIIERRLFDLKYKADVTSVMGNKESSYEYMVEIIKLHQRALRFIDTIEQQYSLCFFVLILLQIVMFPLICNLLLMSLDAPLEVFRYGMFAACVVVHLFNMMWPGQKLINHADRIFKAACYNEWYTCSMETKKILRLFMLRSSYPTVLTAGGLTIMNFENFFGIVKTAVSYVTVFASFR